MFERHGERPAVGERAREFVRDARTGRVSARLLPRYELTTYRQLWSRVRAVASEWHHHPRHPLAAGDRVAILGFGSRDYATLNLACGYLGVVSVPLQTGASAENLASIMAETEPSLLAASVEHLGAATELALRAPSVRRLVVFDHDQRVDDQAERFAAARDGLARAGRDVDVVALPEVLDLGATLPEVPPHVPGDDEDPLAMLVYTSGSTGTPKGAIYTERLARVMWEDRANRADLVAVNYMPLSHIGGHFSLMNALARGGLSCFTAGSDLSTFFEDIALVRPTELSLVPRVCEMLYQRYRSELDRRTGEGAATEVLTRLREDVLGGRVGWATCGSAPLSATLTEFVEALLGVPLYDMYGSTEVAGIAVNGTLMNPPVIDYKLVDVPELGYFRTDVPHPRGELLLKADGIPGYYRQPELTAALFDEDGYYRTGDIVAELGPRRIAVVDRLKSVVKLSQGEFVAVARLESLFATAPLVRQVFVHGDSERSYLLAVVVPTEDALEEHGADPDRLEHLLTESFRRIAQDTGLKSYEVPRGLLLETEPFSQANGLLSDQRKLLWPKLVERYGERLDRRYADISAREACELLDLSRTGADQPVLETVQRAARALLSGSTAEVSPSAYFRDLGGDSLSAVSLSNLLQDAFGVRVPVDVIISPAHDLRQVADYLEAKLPEVAGGATASRPSFASVHGEDAAETHAKDLTLDRFVDAATLDGARHLPRPEGEPRRVLLTGASGYLGRFLTLDWLRRLAPVAGRLIVVVRGKDPDAARQRLVDAFGSDDPDLARTVGELAAEHLEVLAGDIAEPRLGLDEATWQRLTGEVDLIVHAGALVNHVLPYRHLFEANVLGTAEVIRLSLTDRLKPITYISSVAVSRSRRGQPLDEDSDVRAALPVQPVDDGYAGGYTTSKWAGEVLLREAHDLCGLPVTVFRSTMILAHGEYAGQVNVHDMFSRLLFSLLATGVAPRSFYLGGDRAHYDGLPVDFTAASIVALGRNTSGYRTFNLVNPHDDGISLDTFVDWLVEDGHAIERIEDHGDWLVRVEAALRTLPESQRQYSILPLLHGFREPEPAVPGSDVPSARFREAVQQTGDIPHLSRSLVRKCATDLRRLMTGKNT
ncbi:thioester reductase domain-containing protein [Umezawaea endophytica]|uniref:Thioester reductase domain-containing protein n=1 Tax=Umezawaea endophytica TaxID=1654476 RepID=A0A9X2VIG8_9PSEU|nr:thioester reductase domain-containing protein [Umezawaea endophytica]